MARWYLIRTGCGKEWADYMSDRKAEKLACNPGWAVYALTDAELIKYEMTGKVDF